MRSVRSRASVAAAVNKWWWGGNKPLPLHQPNPMQNLEEDVVIENHE
jgi:hypothetical protein